MQAQFFCKRQRLQYEKCLEGVRSKHLFGKYRCIVNLLFKGSASKSDGADDAKPEAKKTLRKENTETFPSL